MAYDIKQILEAIDSRLDAHSQRQTESYIAHREELRNMVIQTIDSKVNGKIDRLSKTLNDHITKVEPVISKYENEQTVNKYISGKYEFILKVSSVITAIGVIGAVIWVIIKFAAKQ